MAGKKSRISFGSTTRRGASKPSQNRRPGISSNSNFLSPSEIESMRKEFREAEELMKGRFSHLK